MKRIIAFQKGRLLIHNGSLPFQHELINLAPRGETFSITTPFEATIMNTDSNALIGEYVDFRKCWQIIPHQQWQAAAKGAELLHWASAMNYCANCGHHLQRVGEICFRCPKCGREEWPRLNPAIMVLVKRNDEILLVHARTFRTQAFGLVAGFVETGETPEQCVLREVKEETNLEITNVKYIESQSWPFPASLMIGFTAEYASGQLSFCDGELDKGGFYSRDNLPEIASPPSLAHILIQRWKDGLL